MFNVILSANAHQEPQFHQSPRRPSDGVGRKSVFERKTVETEVAVRIALPGRYTIPQNRRVYDAWSGT